LTPAQLADLKSKSRCNKCDKFGHWASDHNSDGTLKASVLCTDSPASSSKSGPPKKSLTFNMACLSSNQMALNLAPNFVGPLLDNAAPYSGIGIEEFKLLQPLICPDWAGKFDPLPSEVSQTPFWQYGSGLHSSEARPILGSLLLSACTDRGTILKIRHLFIEGASQWVVGRNVTTRCNILHIGKNVLQLPDSSSNDSPSGELITLADDGMHSFIPYELFFRSSDLIPHEQQIVIYCATAQLERTNEALSWPKTRKIIDKVHTHVCGHSSFSDIKVLLQRNDIWNESVQDYLAMILERCTSCKTTSLPKQTRKVSLSSLNRSFKDLVCVDHMYLEDNCVLHIMDATTRYSAGLRVLNTGMDAAISTFESQWISPFWIPEALLCDLAFDNQKFRHYINAIGCELRLTPARRHNKNVLESKHRTIRDIYLRLKIFPQQ